MIKWLKNFYFLYPALSVATFMFQCLYCHKLSSTIIGWVVQIENHLSKVTLEREQEAGHYSMATYMGIFLAISYRITPWNYLTALTFPNSFFIFRKRLWNILWPVYGRVLLGDISGSVTQKKLPKYQNKNANMRWGSKNMHFFSWTLRVLWAQCERKASP